MSIEITKQQVNEKFLLPFQLYLDTGISTIKRTDFLDIYGRVMQEIEEND
jgi:hypothetical protein